MYKIVWLIPESNELQGIDKGRLQGEQRNNNFKKLPYIKYSIYINHKSITQKNEQPKTWEIFLCNVSLRHVVCKDLSKIESEIDSHGLGS